MQIFNLRPLGAGGAVALFDVQISADIKLLDWTLKQGRDGRFRVYPPSPRHGRPSAVIAPALFAEINLAAIAATTGGARLGQYAA